MLCHHWQTGKMPFKWRFADLKWCFSGQWWPGYSGIWILPPLIILKKQNKKVGPPLTKLSGSAHQLSGSVHEQCSNINIYYIPGFQLDWNLLRTFLSKQPQYCSDIWEFLGHFFRYSFYHHKRKLLSALLIMKLGVVLLPVWTVSVAWLIGWLFI